jgi:hypothetical protein
MADVIKKNTKTLSLKNPTSSSLTKIIKDKLDVDINNIKGSDIPRLFKQGLKFKGILGKRIIDGISSFIKKNPDTKKQYEKFLPDSLKKSIKKDKKIVKTPTNITPKKIKKIDISNIMKNPRTGRGQNLPTRVTDKNKNTGTNLTKRVLEGEVLQGLKKPKGVNNRGNQQTVDGKFQNITPKSNRISNIRTPNLNVKGIRPKAVVDALNDFPKFKTKEAPAKEIKKVKPPKDFTPKIKTPKTPKVIKKELPKLKSNDYTGRFIDKKGDVAYDSFSDFMAHMTGKPKKRKMPKKTARIIGTGDKLKRKDADKKGAGKGVKFKAFKSGTKDKTVGLKEVLPPKSQSPGIHKLPAKAKMNMGFKPMFGGGFISSLYDKPEKIEKYKGNTTSARQVKGYGKAKKKA